MYPKAGAIKSLCPKIPKIMTNFPKFPAKVLRYAKKKAKGGKQHGTGNYGKDTNQ
ncbi:MAG: hypothetical protein HDR22_02395 [Lachnospiraceae bacterium]|nr:hypothetical protein [Lachnospiraceae bacterium]